MQHFNYKLKNYIMCGFIIIYFCFMVLFLYTSSCVLGSKCVMIFFFFQSRERSDKFPGVLLPSRCLKRQQKEKMLGEDVPMWAIHHVNDMGVLNSSWKEEKSSNFFQEVQNGVGYVDPPKECK